MFISRGSIFLILQLHINTSIIILMSNPTAPQIPLCHSFIYLQFSFSTFIPKTSDHFPATAVSSSYTASYTEAQKTWALDVDCLCGARCLWGLFKVCSGSGFHSLVLFSSFPLYLYVMAYALNQWKKHFSLFFFSVFGEDKENYTKHSSSHRVWMES